MRGSWPMRPVLKTEEWDEGDWEYVEWCDRTIRVECLLMRGDEGGEINFQYDIDSESPTTGYQSAESALEDAVDKIAGYPDYLYLLRQGEQEDGSVSNTCC